MHVDLHKNRKLRYFQCEFCPEQALYKTLFFQSEVGFTTLRFTKEKQINKPEKSITPDYSQYCATILLHLLQICSTRLFPLAKLSYSSNLFLNTYISQKFFSLVYVDASIYETLFCINIYIVLIFPCLG